MRGRADWATKGREKRGRRWEADGWALAVRVPVFAGRACMAPLRTLASQLSAVATSTGAGHEGLATRPGGHGRREMRRGSWYERRRGEGRRSPAGSPVRMKLGSAVSDLVHGRWMARWGRGRSSEHEEVRRGKTWLLVPAWRKDEAALRSSVGGPSSLGGDSTRAGVGWAQSTSGESGRAGERGFLSRGRARGWWPRTA